MTEPIEAQSTVRLPRVAIKFCVQCKWNLRAAYYAQELLQTFSTTLGEVALIPVTGGVFTVDLYQAGTEAGVSVTTTTQIWDRKTDGGFPETKELKNRVRNLVDPDRDMGHIDRVLKKGQQQRTVVEGGKKEVGAELREGVGHQHGETGVEDCEECRQAVSAAGEK